MTEHDALVAGKVALVLCGGEVDDAETVSEEHLLALEREAFLSLLGEPRTHERIEHMLKTGSPCGTRSVRLHQLSRPPRPEALHRQQEAREERARDGLVHLRLHRDRARQGGRGGPRC